MSPVATSSGAGAKRYYGKYRGLVVDNVDPLQIGRIMAQVSDVFGETPSSWAMPCVPAAGIQAGCFIVPPIGSEVWIEFEQGDSDYPIWTGGFWGTRGGCSDIRHCSARNSTGTEHCAADYRGKHGADQRCGAYARNWRNHFEEHERRHDRCQRNRHLHQQRTGGHDHADRAGGGHQ